MSDHDTSVRENPAEHRFEIWVDDRLAGVTAYEPDGSTYAFTHTVTEPEFSGRGLGSRLVGTALDTMRERDLAVLPLCPFVLHHIQQHPEYTDLVPAARRADFDLPTDPG